MSEPANAAANPLLLASPHALQSETPEAAPPEQPPFSDGPPAAVAVDVGSEGPSPRHSAISPKQRLHAGAEAEAEAAIADLVKRRSQLLLARVVTMDGEPARPSELARRRRQRAAVRWGNVSEVAVAAVEAGTWRPPRPPYPTHREQRRAVLRQREEDRQLLDNGARARQEQEVDDAAVACAVLALGLEDAPLVPRGGRGRAWVQAGAPLAAAAVEVADASRTAYGLEGGKALPPPVTRVPRSPASASQAPTLACVTAGERPLPLPASLRSPATGDIPRTDARGSLAAAAIPVPDEIDEILELLEEGDGESSPPRPPLVDAAPSSPLRVPGAVLFFRREVRRTPSSSPHRLPDHPALLRASSASSGVVLTAARHAEPPLQQSPHRLLMMPSVAATASPVRAQWLVQHQSLSMPQMSVPGLVPRRASSTPLEVPEAATLVGTASVAGAPLHGAYDPPVDGHSPSRRAVPALLGRSLSPRRNMPSPGRPSVSPQRRRQGVGDRPPAILPLQNTSRVAASARFLTESPPPESRVPPCAPHPPEGTGSLPQSPSRLVSGAAAAQTASAETSYRPLAVAAPSLGSEFHGRSWQFGRDLEWSAALDDLD